MGTGQAGSRVGCLKKRGGGGLEPLYKLSMTKCLEKLLDKAELFAENLRNLILITQVSFYLLSLLELI